MQQEIKKNNESQEGIWKLGLGCNFVDDSKIEFNLWAPYCNDVRVNIRNKANEKLQSYLMDKDKEGYHYLELSYDESYSGYSYLLDSSKELPDPVSRFLPDGLHSMTSIINPYDFKWGDGDWKGIGLKDYIIYELHIGTYTEEGTFSGLISKLDYLVDLGITCIEIMPVAQFPGNRNWGYDGASLFAVHNSYGTPEDFKRLINECHCRGIAVCLDVVYNHLGPEGNYLNEYGPYFTDQYHTPWGTAINYDRAYSDHVREFIISNALYWIHEYHIDALRLDAVHSIYDFSAYHILEELNDNIKKYSKTAGRKVVLFAESDLNDTRIIKKKKYGGYEIDAQWSDDFHHSLHSLITGERNGYYSDFSSIQHLAKSVQNAFVYDGEYSKFRKRRHGNSTIKTEPSNYVISVQNHDQIGNRMLGDRLNQTIGFEMQKVTAFLLVLLPYIPLVFMGQEFGDKSPFNYFIDHSDLNLINAVREGRRKEFASFGWDKIPDPNSIEVFNESKINWELMNDNEHVFIKKLYKDLFSYRKEDHFYKDCTLDDYEVSCSEENQWIAVKYKLDNENFKILLITFSKKDNIINFPFDITGDLRIILDSDNIKYGGADNNKNRFIEDTIKINKMSAVLYSNNQEV